jgi:hypothetical protein
MPAGVMRDMLTAQAGLLRDGAREMEARALAIEPVMGSA